LTDDGLPPLAASGLKLQDRLSEIAASLDRVAARAGGLPGGLKRLQQLLRRGLEETAALFPPVREAYRWVKRVARILKNEGQLPAAKVRRRLVQLLVRMRRAAATAGEALGPGGPEAVPEGDPELLAGLVSVLRRGGLAADEQRFGAHLRQPSLPRASGQRSASGPAGFGCDGLGAGHLGMGDAAAAGGRLGVAAGLCGGLVGVASGVGAAARVAAPAAAIPP
jgi:hypothetical protein